MKGNERKGKEHERNRSLRNHDSVSKTYIECVLTCRVFSAFLQGKTPKIATFQVGRRMVLNRWPGPLVEPPLHESWFWSRNIECNVWSQWMDIWFHHRFFVPLLVASIHCCFARAGAKTEQNSQGGVHNLLNSGGGPLFRPQSQEFRFHYEI